MQLEFNAQSLTTHFWNKYPVQSLYNLAKIVIYFLCLFPDHTVIALATY